MQAAAIVITLIALYAALYSFCRVAAEAEANADRYKRRISGRRGSMPPVWRMKSAKIIQMEVARGR